MRLLLAVVLANYALLIQLPLASASASVAASQSATKFAMTEFFATNLQEGQIAPIVVPMDIDDDGDMDAVIVPSANWVEFGIDATPVPLQIFRNTGTDFVLDPKLLKGKTGIMNTTGNNVWARDFSGDGRPDLYIGESGADIGENQGVQNMVLLVKKRRLHAPRRNRYPKHVEWTHDSAVGDADGDGSLDILEGNIGVCCNDEDVLGSSLMFNNGKGTFQRRIGALPDVFRNVTGRDMVVDINAAGFIDFDQDGDQDLALATSDPLVGGIPQRRHHLLLNNGDGTFDEFVEGNPLLQPAPDVKALDFVATDLNRDQWPDLVILNGTDDGGLALQILLNQADGTFRDASKMIPNKFNRSPDFLRIADANGDGWPDLFFTVDGGSGPKLTLLTNDRGRRFKPVKKAFPASQVVRTSGELELADIDGDGDIDFFVGSLSERWYYGENLSPDNRR